MSGTGGSERARCEEGNACDCSGGLVGATVCVTGIEICDCSACPAAPPVEKDPVFAGCGGEPFGTWGAARTDWSALKWSFATLGAGGNPIAEAACPVGMPDFDEPVLMLRLDDGGKGAVYFSGIAGRGTLLESCVTSLGASCDSFSGCATSACGTCECESEPYVLRDHDMTWVRQDARLTLSVGAVELSFDYCVLGDTLTLKPTDGSDVVFELKNGYAHGTPTACSLRDVDECASTGCRVGVCSGAGGTCGEGVDETSCTNRAGCAWDPTRCAGSITPCALEHYGTTPGCEFTPSAVCGGAPTPCNTKGNIGACDATPGCYWGASVGCNGTPGACSTIPLDTCESVGGCSITPG